MPRDLSERQSVVYAFIKSRIRVRGVPPTVREIGDEFGIKSPNGVMAHLKALEKKGWIVRDRNLSRSIRLLMDLDSAHPDAMDIFERIASTEGRTVRDISLDAAMAYRDIKRKGRPAEISEENARKNR